MPRRIEERTIVKADRVDAKRMKRANSACFNQSIVVVSCGVQGLHHRPDVLDTIGDVAEVATGERSFSDQMICAYISMRYEQAHTHGIVSELCRGRGSYLYRGIPWNAFECVWGGQNVTIDDISRSRYSGSN